MGGSTEFGGMWPEEATAELWTNGVGRPALPAGGVSLIPLPGQPSTEGYSEDGNLDEPLEPPALFKIRLIVGGQVRTHRLRWAEGRSLRQYLREAGLISARLRLALNIDGRKRVSMSYVPRCGESLNMVSPQRPLHQLRDT